MAAESCARTVKQSALMMASRGRITGVYGGRFLPGYLEFAAAEPTKTTKRAKAMEHRTFGDELTHHIREWKNANPDWGTTSISASTDSITLVAAALVLSLAATFACLLPALRAARISPIIALRE